MRIDRKIRSAIRQIYRGICQYCGADNAGHVDHIVPRSQGGKDALENYILACERCNKRKSDGQIAPQYLALITAIADKNKNRILRALSSKSQRYIAVGLSPRLCTRIPLSRPHTMTVSELEAYKAASAFWLKIKNAIQENSAQQ